MKIEEKEGSPPSKQEDTCARTPNSQGAELGNSGAHRCPLPLSLPGAAGHTVLAAECAGSTEASQKKNALGHRTNEVTFLLNLAVSALLPFPQTRHLHSKAITIWFVATKVCNFKDKIHSSLSPSEELKHEILPIKQSSSSQAC